MPTHKAEILPPLSHPMQKKQQGETSLGGRIIFWKSEVKLIARHRGLPIRAQTFAASRRDTRGHNSFSA